MSSNKTGNSATLQHLIACLSLTCRPVLCLLALLVSCSLSYAQSCTVTPANGAYGAVDILAGTAVDTTTTFTISCSGTSNQTVRACVELSPGQTNVAGQRRLASGTYRLVHELYADPARATIWGSWGASTTMYGLYPFGQTVDVDLNSSGSGSALLTVYGRISANQQTAGPGSYIWTMTTAPSIAYDYRTATPCPTGAKQATAGGSTWTASISDNCTVSATPLSFGTAGLLVADLNAQSAVSVTCTANTAYTIGLNAGTGTGATVGARKLTSGADQITYTIYRDSNRTLVWGNTAGSDTEAGTGSGSAQVYPIYGQVPTQATPAPGTYSDVIVVTVTY